MVLAKAFLLGFSNPLLNKTGPVGIWDGDQLAVLPAGSQCDLKNMFVLFLGSLYCRKAQSSASFTPTTLFLILSPRTLPSVILHCPHHPTDLMLAPPQLGLSLKSKLGYMIQYSSLPQYCTFLFPIPPAWMSRALHDQCWSLTRLFLAY